MFKTFLIALLVFLNCGNNKTSPVEIEVEPDLASVGMAAAVYSPDGYSVGQGLRAQGRDPKGSIGKWPGGHSSPSVIGRIATILVVLIAIIVLIVYGIRQSRSEGKAEKTKKRSRGEPGKDERNSDRHR